MRAHTLRQIHLKLICSHNGMDTLLSASTTKRPCVVLGISASVAAVKWVQLVLSLLKSADVCIVATKASNHFMKIAQNYNPAGFGVLCSLFPSELAKIQSASYPDIPAADSTIAHPEAEGIIGQLSIYADEDEWASYESVHGDPVLHIELRKRADLLLIAPLSANTLAKISTGQCDNLLTCVARAWDFKGGKSTGSGDSVGGKPFLVAPAMNTAMWEHPITSEQLATLQKWGIIVLEPISKTLACGDVGKGAMLSVDAIVEQVRRSLRS